MTRSSAKPAAKTSAKKQKPTAGIPAKTTKSRKEFETALTAEFEKKFPPLNRKDFASEDAYRAALLDRRTKLRCYEYEMTNEATCLEYYLEGMSHNGKEQGTDNANFPNKSLKLRGDSNKTVPDSTFTNCPVPARDYSSALNTAPDYCYNDSSCAMTATSRAIATLDKTGIPYEVNKPGEKNKNKFNLQRGTDATASASKNYTALPENYRYDPYGSHSMPRDFYRQKQGKKTVGEVILDGELHAGDQIALVRPKTNSGSHSMTLAKIEYDDTGNPTGYVLQGNNRTELLYYPIPDRQPGKDPIGQLVNNVGQYSRYVQDQVTLETQKCSELSTEELENDCKIATNRCADAIERCCDFLPRAYDLTRTCQRGRASQEQAFAEYLDRRMEKALQNSTEHDISFLRAEMQSQISDRLALQEEEAGLSEIKDFTYNAPTFDKENSKKVLDQRLFEQNLGRA